MNIWLHTHSLFSNCNYYLVMGSSLAIWGTSISKEMVLHSRCGLRASASDLWNLKVFCGPAKCVFYGSIIACQKSLSAGKQMALLQVLLWEMAPNRDEVSTKNEQFQKKYTRLCLF